MVHGVWIPGLAEPVIGPRFARTRWLARDDREFAVIRRRAPRDDEQAPYAFFRFFSAGSLAALRSASLMRLCQPRPVPR